MTGRRVLPALLVVVMMMLPSVYGAERFQPYAITEFDVTYQVSVRNLGPSDAFSIPLRVALLRSWEPYQYVESLTFSPEPDERLEDSLRNSFIIYFVKRLRPGERFTVTIQARLKIYGIDFNIDPRQVGEYERKDPNYLNFITPAKFIESEDPAIRSTARQILRNSSSLVDIVFRSYNWVIDNIDFEKLPLELGAAYAHKNREGDSAEFSNLVVALLRANQIPAQRISGWGGTLSEGGNYTVNTVAHGWAEFYLSNYGWIPLDPAFGRVQRFDNFAKSNDRHIILTKGAGVHLFTRGLYETPFGEADVLTDYDISVNKKTVQYLSLTGQVIIATFFLTPILFFAALLLKASNRWRHRPPRPATTSTA